ncbi:MAG: sigma-70 family RNA polymerase sigma factor [Acidobacteriota bacterium]
MTVVAQDAGLRADRTALEALDDRGLVETCLAGRTEAFDLIVERHRRNVYRLCYRFAGRHEDAADLTQDVFLRAFKGLRSFRGDASLSTWLYRVGVNVCLNRVAAKAPPLDPLDTVPHLPAQVDDPSANLFRAERAARVRAAIGRLPRKQRATLILRVYQELSNQEIADVLGTTVGAVKANVFHSLENLKKMLAKEDVR